jgi:Pilus formation protein N terminal region
MSLSILRNLSRPTFALALAMLLPGPFLAHAAAAAPDAIAVNVDQARLVKLPSRVATIVVGNPLIADVTLQNGGVLVVTGKGYGATNFIAMDRSGEVLVDRQIQVEGPTEEVVTVYRGVDRETWSCKPNCQRRMTLGDGDTYFKSVSDQSNTLNNQASGTASATAGKAP